MDRVHGGTESAAILTPDQRLRVFVSSTLTELAPERRSARAAIEQLHLVPVLFELGARPHPPRALYRAYLRQSHVFVGIYAERYGWIAPDMEISGLEDEYVLSEGKPTLLYIREPAPEREPRLGALLRRIEREGRASYRTFATPDELGEILAEDLALLLTERFEAGRGAGASSLGSLEHRPPPVPATPIVGRDAAITSLAERLSRGDVRLLTLTGIGGVGKTRLALAVAERAASAFDRGPFFVDLASTTEPADVPAAVAGALGMTYERSRDLADAVLETLAPVSALLLLDNLEQVLGAAPFVARILSVCPAVRVLATSREPLHLRGEHRYPVEPLELPEPDATFDAVRSSDAIRLFEARARQVEPSFAVTPENASAVVEICRRLDGLALAIELVAPAIRLLPPAALASRIRDRMDVAFGNVDVPTRQRTLDTTIDWSYALLDEAERRLLARLSVFVGGFALEAVEAVGSGANEADVLGRLASLVDKSLVVSEQDGAGRPRFRLLEAVRAYAEARLVERGETEEVQRRHEAYFVEFSHVAGQGIRNESERDWFQRIAVERPNIDAASARAAERGDHATALELGLSTWIYSQMTCENADKGPMVEALYAQQLPLPDETRAWLGFAAGGLRLTRRDVPLADAAPPLRDAVALWRTLDQRLREADAEVYLGISMAPNRSHLERAASLYEELGDVWGTAWVEGALAMVALMEGSLSEAETRLRASLRLARSIESDWLSGGTLNAMGFLALAKEDAAGASGSFSDAATLLLGVYDREGLADCLCGFAALALRSGDAEEAAVLIGAADATRERIGYFSSVKFNPAIGSIASEVRAALSEDAFRERRDVGADLTTREAVERAMRRVEVAAARVRGTP